jgi:hypothetical protein
MYQGEKRQGTSSAVDPMICDDVKQYAGYFDINAKEDKHCEFVNAWACVWCVCVCLCCVRERERWRAHALFTKAYEST